MPGTALSRSEIRHLQRRAGGLGWQWVNLAYLLGGLFLLWQKAIRWHIPVSFLVTLAVCATLGWVFSPEAWPARRCICSPARPCWAPSLS
jgi:Na+-translocating ferredoxin:NAD+ oxidoreductase RnfD subunit